MAYLGQPGVGRLRAYPDAFEALREELLRQSVVRAGEAEHFIDALDPAGSAVAYLFRCTRCGAHRAEWDAD